MDLIVSKNIFLTYYSNIVTDVDTKVVVTYTTDYNLII